MTPTRIRARQNLCNAISACFTAAMLVAAPASSQAGDVPTFAVDAAWPKPLPNNWILGQVGGMGLERRADPVDLAGRGGGGGVEPVDPPALAEGPGSGSVEGVLAIEGVVHGTPADPQPGGELAQGAAEAGAGGRVADHGAHDRTRPTRSVAVASTARSKAASEGRSDPDTRPARDPESGCPARRP